MTILIEDESTTDLGLDYDSLAVKVIEGVLDYEDCPYEAEVNLILTTDEEIAKMNKQFRGIDRATDVLSFPNVDFTYPADFAAAEADVMGNFNPDTGELILGDIIISTDKAASQAAEFGHTIEREVAFLIAHSVLHLLGYDHMEADEAEVMEAKQKEYLINLNIKR